MTTLEKFLEMADVPVLRKDISQKQNVKWLKYNMWIRNRSLPGFTEAEQAVETLFNQMFNLKEKR